MQGLHKSDLKPAARISRSEGGLALSWDTYDGQVYTVETNADLMTSGWGSYTNIVGDGAAYSFTNTPEQAQLFYKVILE